MPTINLYAGETQQRMGKAIYDPRFDDHSIVFLIRPCILFDVSPLEDFDRLTSEWFVSKFGNVLGISPEILIGFNSSYKKGHGLAVGFMDSVSFKVPATPKDWESLKDLNCLTSSGIHQAGLDYLFEPVLSHPDLKGWFFLISNPRAKISDLILNQDQQKGKAEMEEHQKLRMSSFSNGLSCGAALALLFLCLIQDIVGKSAVLKLIEEHWISTPWLVWVVLIALVLFMAFKEGQNIRLNR